MSEKNDINIIAKTVEEFTELSEKIKILPAQILFQIETVESSMVGVKCLFRNLYNTDTEYFIPNNTTQIKNFGGDSNGIRIYADDFYFIIPKDAMEYNISYVLIPLKEIE